MLQSIISRLEGDLPSPLEKEYGQHYLRDDSRQAMISIALLTIYLTVFIYNDYLLLGLSTTFYIFLAIRSLMLVNSIILLIYLIHVKNRSTYEWLTFVWALVGVALITMVDFTRPQGYVLQITLDIIVILVIYFGIPNRLLFWIFISILFSTSIIYTLISLGGEISQTGLFTSVFSLLLVNVGGLFITRRIYSYRRKQFMIRHELDRLACNDSLTGILNRRMFIELAEKEFSRFKRYGETFVLLIIDIDFFKEINDTHGHLEGDKVLIKLVDVVNNRIRGSDIFGRIGGDEFGILLIETSIDKVSNIAEQIRDACRESSIITNTGNVIKFTISLGMTETFIEASNLDQIIQKADTALYKAKNAGRNGFEIA